MLDRRTSSLGQKTVIILAVVWLLSLTAAPGALADGVHLGMGRARDAVRESVAHGCAGGVCQSWSVSHCERRSSRTVRCLVTGVVRRKPCRVRARAFLTTRRPRKVLVGPIAYTSCALEIWEAFSPPEFVVPPGAESGR
jgi:hypothetical protein